MTLGYPSTNYARRTPSQSKVLGRDSVLRNLDWTLNAAVFALLVIGTALVYAATRPHLLDLGQDPQYFIKRHVLDIVIGLALGIITTLLDYRMLRAYAPLIYVASIIGLLAVLSPLGKTVNGAHSWIFLPGGFQLQPSELAKVALVVGVAMLLAEKRDRETAPSDRDVAMALAFAAVPLALIMLQPDLGTAMVFCCILIGMLAVSGAGVRWIIGLLGAGAVVTVVAIKLHILSTYQVNRFSAFANPNADPQGVGYNTRQARIAIGSGGMFGKGLFHGTQTNGHFVPEQQTDFIFTVAGEELGLVGAAVIILLLAIVLWRAIRIAMRAEDMFGALVATGIVCWFAFQIFENIGMTMGIMPVTGLPLPFVSYGGSAMFANLMAIGLLQNIRLRRYI